MRSEEEQRKAMHMMEKKRKPAFKPGDYWKGRPVLAGGRFGYAVSYSDTNNGRPWNKPVQVQFSGTETAYFALGDVTPATFGDYCINPAGFGKMGYLAFAIAMVLAGSGFYLGLMEDGWSSLLFLAAPLGIVGGSWLNFKGIFK